MDKLTKSRREWRKQMKKQQRQRRRKNAALEREEKLREEAERQQNDPIYQETLKQQRDQEILRQEEENRQHDLEEQEWLERERKAQKRFEQERKLIAAREAAEEALRQRQYKELEEQEAAKRRQEEERERLVALANAEFERRIQLMEDFLADPSMEIPQELRQWLETHPQAKICEFYERTNCCRFQSTCQMNHRRPFLGRILYIQNLFTNIALDDMQHKEYSSEEVHLEVSDQDLQAAYDDFFEDVVPEIESFGEIVNFRTVRNVLPHMRGNVFVEYTTERSALKAFIALQGRFYASKPLNVEFSNIRNWRTAICGYWYKGHCPKGHKCNYLHLLKNPQNKYNAPLEKHSGLTPKVHLQKVQANVTPLLSWDDIDGGKAKSQASNWRWSESPEPSKRRKTDGDECNQATKGSINSPKKHKHEPRTEEDRKSSVESSGHSDPVRSKGQRKTRKEKGKHRSKSGEKDEEDGHSRESRSAKKSVKSPDQRARSRDSNSKKKKKHKHHKKHDRSPFKHHGRFKAK